MSEPVTYKTALAAGLVAWLGPDFGQQAVIVLGGTAGGYLSVWLQDPMSPWWRPYLHVFNGVVAALLFASGASFAAELVAREKLDFAIPADVFWLPVSALIAIFWRDALKSLRGWAARILAKGKRS